MAPDTLIIADESAVIDPIKPKSWRDRTKDRIKSERELLSVPPVLILLSLIDDRISFVQGIGKWCAPDPGPVLLTALWMFFIGITLSIALTIRFVRVTHQWRCVAKPLKRELRKPRDDTSSSIMSVDCGYTSPVMSHIANCFGALVDQTQAIHTKGLSQSLSFAAIRGYFERLSHIRRGQWGQVAVFPCTFEVYAFTVVEALSIVQSYHRSKHTPDDCIDIWTRFSDDLSYWFNISIARANIEGIDGNVANDASHTRWMHSHKWWEEYKNKIYELRLASTIGRQQPGHDPIFHMRRLVHRSPSGVNHNVGGLSDLDRLYPQKSRVVVYRPPRPYCRYSIKAEASRLSMEISQWQGDKYKKAIEQGRSKSGKSFVTILPFIDNAIRSNRIASLPLTLLGSVASDQWDDAKTEDIIKPWTAEDDGWMDIEDCFAHEFHNHRVLDQDDPDDRGARCLLSLYRWSRTAGGI